MLCQLSANNSMNNSFEQNFCYCLRFDKARPHSSIEKTKLPGLMFAKRLLIYASMLTMTERAISPWKAGLKLLSAKNSDIFSP